MGFDVSWFSIAAMILFGGRTNSSGYDTISQGKQQDEDDQFGKAASYEIGQVRQLS